jgi:hypothetical protein
MLSGFFLKKSHIVRCQRQHVNWRTALNHFRFAGPPWSQKKVALLEGKSHFVRTNETSTLDIELGDLAVVEGEVKLQFGGTAGEVSRQLRSQKSLVPVLPYDERLH